MFEKAEVLFKKYYGSYYQMERDNILDEYLQLKIPLEQEERWRLELFKDFLLKFETFPVVDNTFSRMLEILKLSNDPNLILFIVNALNKLCIVLDSFTKIRICEEIFQFIESVSSANSFAIENLKELKKILRKILNSIDEKKISVNPYYHDLPYLEGLLNEKKLLMRIEKLKKRKM